MSQLRSFRRILNIVETTYSSFDYSNTQMHGHRDAVYTTRTNKYTINASWMNNKHTISIQYTCNVKYDRNAWTLW